MLGFFASIVIVSTTSVALGAFIPYSQLKARGHQHARNSLLECLDSAGLDPVVEGDSHYVTGTAAFNRRCVSVARAMP